MSIDDAKKLVIQRKLTEIIDLNDSIKLIVLVDPTGMPIASLTKDKTELDPSSMMNVAAMSAASSALAVRTLSTLTENDAARVIHVKGFDGNVAIAVSDRLLTLVVTESRGDSKNLAINITQLLKSLL